MQTKNIIDIESPDNDQIITPWEVRSKNGINYKKITDKFGSQLITDELLQKFEKITGHPVHSWLRRGIFFSHRELDDLLDKYATGIPIYIYTGRGPSGEMHLGHALPFIFTRWLQKVLNAIVVIQMADDEKFYFKDLEIEEVYRLGFENAKDIIAFGFNPEKTFIFSNIDYLCRANEMNKKKLMKAINLNQLKHIYGFTDQTNAGQFQWPFHQMTPSFSSSFPHLFGKRTDIPCLVPCAIDQDPYFRSSRDIAPKMGWLKPYLIHGKFLVALQGIESKMSTTGQVPTSIMLSDNPNDIKYKINKYAFSGGRDTLEEHRKYGANLEVDVAYQYLTFFEEDDKKLEEIGKNYSTGIMLSGEIKKYLIEKLVKFTKEHQNNVKEVSQDIIDLFYAQRPLKLN